MATQFDPIAKDESLNTTEATPRNIADVIAEGLKGIEDALPTYTEGDGIDISAQKEISVDTTFTEASTRANIVSGDSFSTILGKIKKFFSDLKTVAFSGAAADVTYGSWSVEDALDDLQPTLDTVTKVGVTGDLYVTKVGKIGVISGYFHNTIALSANTTIGTVPYTPLTNYIICGTGNGAIAYIDTSGNIKIANEISSLSAGYYSIGGTFVTS